MSGLLESIFGPMGPLAQAFVALVIVVAVVLVALFIYRTVNLPRFGSGGRGKQARLAITDAAAVDQRRRLILIRRDDVEHLVLIGGPTDIVVESNIRKNAPARPLDVRSRASTAPQQAQASTQPAQTPARAAPQQSASPEAPPDKSSLLSRIKENVSERRTNEPKATVARPRVQDQPAPPSVAPAAQPVSHSAQTQHPGTQTARTWPSDDHRGPTVAAASVAPQESQRSPQLQPGDKPPAAPYSPPSTSGKEADPIQPRKDQSRASVVEEMDALLNEISTSR